MSKVKKETNFWSVFFRYTFLAYLFLLSFIEKSLVLFVFLLIGFIFHLYWLDKKSSPKKRSTKTFFISQLKSDSSVLFRGTAHIVKQITIRRFIKLISGNKSISLVILFYTLAMLSLINWGIPNPSHPFDYFMDEWHQLQSVRMTFGQGSPNVPGAANGSMFQFVLSGIYLIPFVLFGIINPFVINSSVGSLDVQQTLFQILRLNTLLFGIGCLILLAHIAKKYFKLHPFITVFLITINPLWLMLSNYFKYDFALLFWVLLSFFFLLHYFEKEKVHSFYLASFFAGLALAVKVSVLPLLLLMVFAFFQVNKGKFYNLRVLFVAIAVYLATFVLFGIPDLLLGKGDMREYLYDNLVRTPNLASNYNLGVHYAMYMFTQVIPTAFGYVFFILSLLGVLFSAIFSRKNKYVLLLLAAFVFFALSLFSIKIEARSNRLLVLLPFIALACGIMLDHLMKKKYINKALIGILILIFSFQFAEASSWLAIKYHADPRHVTSSWMANHIPKGSIIGIENIPIYQTLPDIVIKEFYTEDQAVKDKNLFQYEIIDSKKALPEYVIVTTEQAGISYLKESPKKTLLLKLRKENYQKIHEEKLNMSELSFFRTELDFYMSGLVQSPLTISIYKQDKRMNK